MTVTMVTVWLLINNVSGGYTVLERYSTHENCMKAKEQSRDWIGYSTYCRPLLVERSQ